VSKAQKIFGFLLFIVCFSLSTQCSDELTAPQEEELILSNEEAINMEMAGLSAGGVDVEQSVGVFSIGWNQFFRPRYEDSQIVGESFAIGFKEPTIPDLPLSPEGVDMGTVYLNCPDKQIELKKMECLSGGIIYSSFSRPFRETGQSVVYYPTQTYQFEVTGSNEFDPLTFSLVSPPALIVITSHARGDQVNPNEDLTITWDGGYEEEPINIFITASQHHRHRQRGRPEANDGLLEVLETNTGTYTLPASELSRLLRSSRGNSLVVRISQVTITEVDHSGEPVLGTVRNGDGVILGAR